MCSLVKKEVEALKRISKFGNIEIKEKEEILPEEDVCKLYFGNYNSYVYSRKNDIKYKKTANSNTKAITWTSNGTSSPWNTE
jgi:hypothetical protein